MGLFSFVKDAGAKLFGGDEHGGGGAPLATAGSAEAEASRSKLEAARSRRLVAEVEKWGLAVEGLEITVRGDQASVRGTVGSQDDRERVVLVVGNTAGIGEVDDQLVVGGEAEAGAVEATEGAASGTAFYTVQKGDTLSKIAKEQYGKASKYMVIFEANRPMLEDPDRIYPGQVLRIPPLADG